MNRQIIINQVVVLIQEEISNKRGLKGAIVKKAYKAIKSKKPNADAVAVNLLLDDMVVVFDEHYSCWQNNANVDFELYCDLNRTVIAGDILNKVDAKAKQMENKKYSSAYKLIRSSAQHDLETAVPKLGNLIVKNLTL